MSEAIEKGKKLISTAKAIIEHLHNRDCYCSNCGWIKADDVIAPIGISPVEEYCKTCHSTIDYEVSTLYQLQEMADKFYGG